VSAEAPFTPPIKKEQVYACSFLKGQETPHGGQSKKKLSFVVLGTLTGVRG